MKSTTAIVIGILIIIIATYSWYADTDYDDKPVLCTVTGKINVRENFYIILSANGHIFDQLVTPSVYYCAKPGDKLLFRLSEYETNFHPEMNERIIHRSVSALIGVIMCFVGLYFKIEDEQ